MIYTGGIQITKKEINYVIDAIENGWDGHYEDYKLKFEKEFAKYTASKYAYSTTGGTQALWLSLVALKIGEGDEVILPDLTYFACSDVIKLVGAIPVFVDVLSSTWCIDPFKFEEAITPRTKAVMPVWLYGNAPEMEEIMAIARKYNLFIIEDACPAVGTRYQGKHSGTFGTTGCFSFHGAKIMTTGFGGMVVTDDKSLYERIVFLDDHGENKKLLYRFWQEEVGFSFYMHNLNAALGLAQLERIEEFVTKKRQIFQWYKSRLKYPMNYEQTGVRTNKWMTSIIVEDRDNLMKRLKDKGIDTRPFFFPISMFPIYKEVDTPISHHIGLHGMSLPSGIQRTEEEIDFICKTINEN